MPSLFDSMNVPLRRASLKARTCWRNCQRGGGGVEVVGIPRNVQAGAGQISFMVGVREKEEVRVPAAKQLLQGSSSLFDLSHLLLVFRH